MKPVISIIVPIYKVEKYLKRCIDSILNQTFKDFELILVNDGSPDGCGEICDDYSKKDNRIKVIHKKNGGLSDARNCGIDIASGEYIGFVDSDDFIHRDMYKILYELSKKNDFDIVQCKYKKFIRSANFEDFNNKKLNFKVYSSRDAIRNLIDNNNLNVNVWNKLYKRSLFDGVRFPKEKIHEDEFITYKLFYKSNSIVYCDEELYYYFQNDEGIMRSTDLIKRFDRIEALEQRSEFLFSNNEIELYEQSNCSLFFYLTKLYFLMVNNKNIDEEYMNLLKNHIKYITFKIDGSKKLSNANRIIVKLINQNYLFIRVYYFYHYLLAYKYELEDRLSKLNDMSFIKLKFR